MNDIITLIPCHARTVRGLDQPVVFVRDGSVYASSEDVAAYFGKSHYNVMRDIRSLISNDKSCALNFEGSSRPMKMPSGGTRDIAIYTMNRDGFTLLAMGFTGKRALNWKLKYIAAFNAMEEKLANRARAQEPKGSLQTLIDAHRRAYERFLTHVDIIQTAAEYNMDEDAEDRAADELIRYQCQTLEELRQKAGYLAAAPTLGGDMRKDQVRALLYSLAG